MKKQWIVPAALLMLLSSTSAVATNDVAPGNFKEWLAAGKKMIIVDVQPAADFAQHHFKGALQTNAFPGKTEEEKKRLDPALSKIAASQDAVVIVCPRGGGGATGSGARGGGAGRGGTGAGTGSGAANRSS